MTAKGKLTVVALLLVLALTGGVALVLLTNGGDQSGESPTTAAVVNPESRKSERDGGTASERRRRIRTDTRARPDGSAGVAPGTEASAGKDGAGRAPDGNDKAGDQGPDDETAGADAGVTGAEKDGTQPADADAELPERKGRVIDDETSEGIAGARIRFAVVQGELVGGWSGDTSADDGSFHVRYVRPLEAGQHMEVVVSAPGYEVWRAAVGEGDLIARLVRLEAPPAPGTIVGTLRNDSGAGLAGRYQIEGLDASGAYAAQLIRADESGRFRMEGLTPGHWRLGVGVQLAPGRSTRHETVEILVPEGGEVTATFSVPENARHPDEDEREVAVRGFPESVSEGAAVRAELKARYFFRTLVVAGTAEFDLAPGKWTIVATTDDGSELSWPINVESGTEPLSLTLPRQ